MIYVFLAEGFEEVEALTPVDYLRRCGAALQTVGVTGKVVTGSHGISVTADILPEEMVLSTAEMLVLPGGMPGTLHLGESKAVREAVKYCVVRGIPVGAICAAPSVLGELGCLAGRRATCYDGFEDKLIGAEYTGKPVEADGAVITGRGAGTANEFAFALVTYLYGEKRAEELKAAVKWAK